MPAMTKFRRGSGPWVSPDVTNRRRHYQAEDLGVPCLVCALPLVRALAEQGMNTHPTCSSEPD